ncbi:MAG: hypothetical protein Q9187_007110 [Circinaria calcarea]
MSLAQSIQAQWDIGQSIFTIKDRIIELVRAGSEDDVQPQAILAMEGLGAGIIVHNDRIGEGKLALKGGESRRMEKLLLLVGLSGGGVARLMRESTPCIASFLLAVACKTCLTDDETGAILYEMMVLRNVLQTVPVFKEQICQFVGAISGYGYSILPTDDFNKIATVVHENLHYNGGELYGGELVQRLDAKSVAEVLVRTFEALQDDSVTKVTLDGNRAGIWLVSVFLWLRPDDTEVKLYNRRIFGQSGSRLEITLFSESISEPGDWAFSAWHLEKNISTVVVQAELEPFTMHPTYFISHIPLGSAKSYIALQYGMSPESLEDVGRVAAALIDVVFECGEFREYRSNHSSRGTSKPYKQVSFRDISQAAYISKYHTILELFGWKPEATFVSSRQAAIVETFKAWLLTAEPSEILKAGSEDVKAVSGDVVAALIAVLQQVQDQYFKDHQVPLLENKGLKGEWSIFQAVIHITVEALYFSICDRFPSARPFRPLTHFNLSQNAKVLWRLLFHELPNAQGCQLDEYRIEAIKAMLPGTPTVGETDLAVESNGCVAFTSPLLQVTTNRRACYAVSVVPGTLRWGEDNLPFKNLIEIEAQEFYPSVALFQLSALVQPFRGAEYLGLEAQADLFGAHVQMLVSPSGKTLKLSSYIKPRAESKPPSRSKGPLIEVGLLASIRALVFAEHVSGHSITALGEKSLAEAWQERNIFQQIMWSPMSLSGSLQLADGEVT